MDSSLMAQPEDKIGEGQQDKKVKEDYIKQDSHGSSNCSFEIDPKMWCGVCLSRFYQRNKQKALLLDELKCDKSEFPFIYHFGTLNFFEAHLTYVESEKLKDLEEVEDISLLSREALTRNAKRTKSRTFEGLPKRKKQKISKGRVLSEQRENKEKWRYNEDLELVSENEDSDDEDLSDDDPYRIQAYHKFDESGNRCYQVCLEDEITEDDHRTLLGDVLKWDPSELDCSYWYQGDHLFEAHMNEKEADIIAGLKKVEYVEPCSYVIQIGIS